MFRVFNVYYPTRTLILVLGEALMVWTSFLLGTMLRYREDSYLVLNFEYGYLKLFLVTACALLLSHWFDLYDPAFFEKKGKSIFECSWSWVFSRWAWRLPEPYFLRFCWATIPCCWDSSS